MKTSFLLVILIFVLILLYISWYLLVKNNNSQCELIEVKKNNYVNEFKLKNPNYLKEKNYVIDWIAVNLNQRQIDDELFNIEVHNQPMFKCDSQFILFLKKFF